MEIIKSFIKLLIVAILLYVGYLYYTRPGIEITPQTFLNAAQSCNFKVSRSQTSASYKAANYSYTATKKGVWVEYINFKDAEAAKDFYLNFLDRVETKHSHSISRDLRINKNSCEKQSFTSDYDYYIIIYADNNVVYAVADTYFKPELNEIFNILFKSPNIDFSNTFIGKLFPNLKL